MSVLRRTAARPTQSAWKAFRATYQRGCLFHYCQAVYRKVVEFGFLTDYKDTTPTLDWVLEDF